TESCTAALAMLPVCATAISVSRSRSLRRRRMRRSSGIRPPITHGNIAIQFSIFRLYPCRLGFYSPPFGVGELPMNRRNALRIGVLALIWHSTHPAPATAGDAYPSKAVKIISQAPAGNGPDVIARIAADRLSRLWGQQTLIINRPGAGGLLAAQA